MDATERLDYCADFVPRGQMYADWIDPSWINAGAADFRLVVTYPHTYEEVARACDRGRHAAGRVLDTATHADLIRRFSRDRATRIAAVNVPARFRYDARLCHEYQTAYATVIGLVMALGKDGPHGMIFA